MKENNAPMDKESKIKKVERRVLSLLLALVLAAVGFIAGWFGRWGALGKNKQSLLQAIDTAMENYYKDLDEDEFFKNLFAAFAFDRYSTFYTADDFQKIAAEREGQNRDAGFSIYTEQSALIVYNVIEGSSADIAGVKEGMYLFKYGKSADTMTSGNAENYFVFESLLKKNESYYVLCGESENEADATLFEVKNEEKGAGIALTRKSAMRVYQVIGNSPADEAELKRGMYILGFSKTDDLDSITVGTAEDLQNLIYEIEPDEDGNVTFYIQCSFDREDAAAELKPITMKEYQASYCYYRDNESSSRFLATNKGMERDDREEPLEALDDKTAYIELTEFTGYAAYEFKECLDWMKERGRTNLILDLRGNGGGYMDVFVEIASYLLKDATSGSQKVAYAKFRDGSTVSYSARSSSYSTYFNDNSNVSILADEYTASASECLIGALVDYGTVALSDIYLREDAQGEAGTYGKGIMQTYYNVSHGNMLKLTSAEIFWPKSGITIHEVGVTPSLKLEGSDETAQAIKSSLLPAATDAFLLEAIERIQSKTGNASA